MTTTTKLPRQLQPACDEALAAFKAGNSQPDCLRPITKWLEVDGWDALIADLDEGLAIDLRSLSEDWFTDDALREGLEIPDTKRVTDRLRLKWGRRCIDAVLNGEYADSLDSVHTYVLHASDGSTAVLCCTTQIQGQAGPVCRWRGLWPTRKAFLKSFTANHRYWLTASMGEVPDAVILEMWERE